METSDNPPTVNIRTTKLPKPTSRSIFEPSNYQNPLTVNIRTIKLPKPTSRSIFEPSNYQNPPHSGQAITHYKIYMHSQTNIMRQLAFGNNNKKRKLKFDLPTIRP